MTRRYIAAEARELRRGPCAFEVSGVVIVNTHADAAIRCVADINDQPFGPLLAAAPDLAATVCALEAERDALREAVSEMLAAEDALRAFNSPENATTPGPLLEYVKARAPYLERVRESWQALAALREAAK